ncbi:ribosomal-processing cysteine protease Prp [Anaerotalea alkaliphila]|uniref:Ribosomal processing cysteine protease Prp n=1 Tax=Anaerotalea alkaliphila TaxID=2662126 RepID=A0A7X5KND4_9FIRM|nr:ribosomal-processing cysteine protease Prp [Anaerotalea alkaliphila]NDL67919.1 ribosomal-processing cysteine protease Prp [Anaerotalea alkaliphila]
MIHVRFLYCNKQPMGFSMDGHAGFDVHGKDIVCAAVSALALNTVNSIEAFTSDKFHVSVDEEEGSLHFRLEHAPGKEAALLLKSLELGVRGIHEDYGREYIQVKKEEV